MEYLDYKLVMRTETEDLIVPSLPVITICPKIPFKSGPFKKYVADYNATRNHSKWDAFPRAPREYLDKMVGLLDGGQR